MGSNSVLQTSNPSQLDPDSLSISPSLRSDLEWNHNTWTYCLALKCCTTLQLLRSHSLRVLSSLDWSTAISGSTHSRPVTCTEKARPVLKSLRSNTHIHKAVSAARICRVYCPLQRKGYWHYWVSAHLESITVITSNPIQVTMATGALMQTFLTPNSRSHNLPKYIQFSSFWSCKLVGAFTEQHILTQE